MAHNQISPTSVQMGLSRDEELFALREMLLIRRFEEKAGQLYGMGVIAGFCHLYIGQEAVVVGVKMAAKEGDQFTTSYRDHGHMLAMGMDAKGVMAELAGRRSGYSKGKGGSMHMFSREKNFYGGHGIVGAPAPIGAGVAFANAYRENSCVSIAFLAKAPQIRDRSTKVLIWRHFGGCLLFLSLRIIVMRWARLFHAQQLRRNVIVEGKLFRSPPSRSMVWIFVS